LYGRLVLIRNASVASKCTVQSMRAISHASHKMTESKQK